VGIQVLGPLAVDGSGRLGPRDRAVLLALTVRQGHSVTVDELGDAVWGDRPPASAHKNLQSCVVRLRRALGSHAIETTDLGYRLTVPADLVDAWVFEDKVARARDLLALGEADRVVFQLENALELWRGRAFAELADWPPARTEAERFEELRLDAQEMHVDAMLRCGRSREVLARAQELVRSAPLRERRWELLALAQYQSGSQGEALRSLRQLRGLLSTELGIDPSPEMLALERSILQQDPRLLVAKPRAGAGQCPWQGLKAYDLDDTERFFGRDADVAACLAILDRGSFVALVGPSGSGKSSLLRAGVLATLRRRGHRIVLLTPGRRPMQALTALDADAPPGTVLAVDQGEEVFSLCDDPDERRLFLDRLVEESRRRAVLVTVRGDRLEQVTEHAGFSRLVEGGLHLVGTLDEHGLRQAIERPAEQAGLVIEHGLVDVLLHEVRDAPGALPLLSHALLETWLRREGNTLTVEGYRASGGIHGAVAQSAEQLYGRIDPEQRRQLRDLVLRLVSPGAEGEAVRTRVPRRLVAPAHDELVEALVAARLVTSDEGVLEITHESLARAWPRLRGWLEDDVEGQRIRHHLSGAADAWDTLGRPDSELYRGVRLTRALDWQSRTESTLTGTERDFLDAARVQAEIEAQSAAERARAQARLIRRLRIVLGGAVVLLVLALAAGGIAAVQSERANENARQTAQAALSADARRVGVRAQVTDDPTLSMLLAAAGARLDESPETRVNLLTALAKQPYLVRSAPPRGGYLQWLDVSRDGRWIAASDDQNRMHLYDAATSRLLRSYEPDQAAEDTAFILGAFSPDSTQLAVTLGQMPSTDPVRLLDPNTMRPTTRLASPAGEPAVGRDVEFSADGRYLAASILTASALEQRRPDNGVRTFVAIWDLQSPSARPVRVRTGIAAAGQGVALSPDGRTLYTSWPFAAYDVATGKQIWERPEVHSAFHIDVDPQGTLLALEFFETQRDALLVDAATGMTVHRLRGHTAWVRDIRFSHDGSRVGSVSDDGDLIVWDSASGLPLEKWYTSDAWGVGFSPGNDLVYGGGGVSMLRTWDRSVQDTYVQRTTVVQDTELFAHADLSPDGARVAYRWVDESGRGRVRFVDTLTGDATAAMRLPVRDGFGGLPLGTWRQDGRRYASHGCDDPCEPNGAVSLLDPTTGRLVGGRRNVLDGDGDLLALTYSHTGRRLIVGDSDNRTTLLDADTLLPSGERLDVPGYLATPVGDGSVAMVFETPSGGESVHWRQLEVDTGAVLSEGDVDTYAYTSVASPDGSTVAVAGFSGEIVTIDVSSGGEVGRSTSVGAEVLWLNFSDDGELLVAGAADGGVSLVDATTLVLVGTVHPPHYGDPVPAGAQFIGDTHNVVIASYDGSIYRWDTDLDRALEFACQMAGRDLTEDEWAQFLPAQPYRPVCPEHDPQGR
jgi:DNA-binding SARP family transcriptional activator/WD40 repeat protein/energy-coupling factor transporter ATP-binding protein EcfA2